MTQALILAAGNGSRLGSAANGLPKCMIRVGPDSLIGHQTRALRAAGVSRIAAVVGYGAERVQEHCGDGLSYVHNERFKETNSLYSLWLARHWIDGPFYLLNCDVLFCDQVLGRLAAIPGSALAFDALSGHDPEHMKVCIRDQLVCGLGKSMPRSLTRGENIGVLRFDACSAESLFRAAGQLIADGQLTAWAPAAVERMTVECDVRAVDVSDLPWCEIDFPGDLDEARNRVWPLIAAGRETNPRVAECDSVRAGAAPPPGPVPTPAGVRTIGVLPGSPAKENSVTKPTNVRVLFTGYAWVHFACFHPLFQRMTEMPGVDIRVSGGLRSDEETEDAERVRKYDLRGMYDPFGVPEDLMLSVEEIRDQDFDVVFAANTKMILPRSVHTKVQIFHGISFRNKAVRDENAGADYYFIVGPYMRRAFAQSGILPEHDPRALKIGFPKTDRLLNGEVDRNELLRRLGLSGHRPVIVYAPTGQKHNSLETMGEEVIRQIAATGKYDLIIKPHDHPKNADIDWDARLSALVDDHTKLVRDPDIIPLLLLADLLITDASSVSSEFALRDQPMVFLDVPDLLARASSAGGSKVDLKTWGRRCGVLVEQPSDVAAAVQSSLAHPFRYAEVRRAMAQDLFYNAGHATDAAMAWFSRKFAPAASPSTAAIQ